VKESPLKEFLYWSDDGDLFAIRVLDWKMSFIEQYHEGLGIWERDFTRLRLPQIYNLRSDPFERGPSSFLYGDWKIHRAFLLVPAQEIVAQWLDSFKDYPIRQKPASFNLDEVMRKLTPQSISSFREEQGGASGTMRRPRPVVLRASWRQNGGVTTRRLYSGWRWFPVEASQWRRRCFRAGERETMCRG
jgi:hypothetical protein